MGGKFTKFEFMAGALKDELDHRIEAQGRILKLKPPEGKGGKLFKVILSTEKRIKFELEQALIEIDKVVEEFTNET